MAALSRSTLVTFFFLLFFISLAISIPEQAAAHVKWFISQEDASKANFFIYSLTDPAVMTWIVIAVLLISASILLDSHLPSLPEPDSRARLLSYDFLRICTGLSLLLTAYNGAVIAPHYMAQAGLGETLLLLETIIALMLLFNFYSWLAAGLLVILALGVIISFGIVEALEYLNVIGIALFMFFHYVPSPHWRLRLHGYSIAALRILTGISLVTLALTEKLLNPEFGQKFIRDYDWNFMYKLGIEAYSDALFVLSAGMMELVFGIILILGTTTRLNILVVSVFMLTSNITFLMEGNIAEAVVEIIGHLPIIGTAVICIFFGSGQKLKVTSLWKGSHHLQKVTN